MRERAKSAGVIHWAESDWVQRRTSSETVFRYLYTPKIRLWIVNLSLTYTYLGPNYQSDLVKWNEAPPLTQFAPWKCAFMSVTPKKVPKFASQVTWIVADSEAGERREKGEQDEEGNAIFDLAVGEDEQVRMLPAKLTKRWWVTYYGCWSGVRNEKDWDSLSLHHCM